MLVNRRWLFWGAGGSALSWLGRSSLLKAKTSPPLDCMPTDQSPTLVYPDPSSLSLEKQITAIEHNFEVGLQRKFSGLTIDPLRGVLEDAYKDGVADAHFEKPEHAKAWILAHDHAFILGQLTGYHFLKEYPGGKENGKPAKLKKRHLLRAMVVFNDATSSRDCVDYIKTKGAYDLPHYATVAVKGNDWLPPSVRHFFEIDEPCCLC